MTKWTPKFYKMPHGDYIQETPDGPLKKLEGSLHGTITPVDHPAQIPAIAAKSALDVQVAGGHYKTKRIQPVEYITANNLTFLEGCIVKRITRWRDKSAADRFEDLEKIKHEVDLLIEMEKQYGEKA